MLITQLKQKEELIQKLQEPVFILRCVGCKEVYFPVHEIEDFIREIKINVSADIIIDYLCNAEFSREYINKHQPEILSSNTVIVFSCGVGVQTIASLLEEKTTLAGCDTIYINGFQGLTAQNYDCAQCGECYLNYTGGICPITACSKGLLNGPCGGAKNGKCEVNKEMDCGWEKIYKKLSKLKMEGVPWPVNIRDYYKLI
ncbi:MAG: methylenetetrahydrofolate reductase C-terminal domain-containing protein [Elusimicrobiota bacterium]